MSTKENIETVLDEEQRFKDMRALAVYRRTKQCNPFEATLVLNTNRDAIARAMAAERAENKPGPDKRV